MAILPRAFTLLYAWSVLARLHALPVTDNADLLSVHFRERHHSDAHSALLDQHGSGSHHHTRRRATNSGRAGLEFSQRNHAVSERIHALLLGGRHVVDTAFVHTRVLETHLQTLSTSLRSAVLGHGLPDGNVHGLHFSIIQSD